MPRTRAVTFDAQRAAILRAAADLFAEYGFAATSMAQLAERCGVSKALLYHYYRAKEDILFDLVDGHAQRLVEIVRAVRGSPGEDALANLIRRFLQEYESAQAQHRVLVQDVKFLPQAQRQVVVARQREIVQAFSHEIAKTYPELSARALAGPLAMLLFGMINWHFTWLKPGGKLSYADLAELVIAMFEGGLGALNDRRGARPAKQDEHERTLRGNAHG